MEKKHRIVIAEDHTILREGLRLLLSRRPGLEIVGEAGDGLEAIALVRRTKPDLALMDLSMPKMNGIEAIREITRLYPETRVLVLTVHKTEEHYHSALKAGAVGYVLKDASHGELIAAIDAALAGGRPALPDLGLPAPPRLAEGKSGGTTPVWDTVTLRERQVLKMIAEGLKSREIAEHLCISVKTVEKHRTNLMRKLDLHSIAAITVYAEKKGLIG